MWELIPAPSPPSDENKKESSAKAALRASPSFVTVVPGIIIVGVVFAWRKVAKYKKARVTYTNILDAKY